VTAGKAATERSCQPWQPSPDPLRQGFDSYVHLGRLQADASGGHPDRLSVAERQLIQRAAVTGALIEDMEARWIAGQPIDAMLLAALGNAQRRLLCTVGLRRAMSNVMSLEQYLVNTDEHDQDDIAKGNNDAGAFDEAEAS
jgi:hypothetical protein